MGLCTRRVVVILEFWSEQLSWPDGSECHEAGQSEFEPREQWVTLGEHGSQTGLGLVGRGVTLTTMSFRLYSSMGVARYVSVHGTVCYQTLNKHNIRKNRTASSHIFYSLVSFELQHDSFANVDKVPLLGCTVFHPKEGPSGQKDGVVNRLKMKQKWSLCLFCAVKFVWIEESIRRLEDCAKVRFEDWKSKQPLLKLVELEFYPHTTLPSFLDVMSHICRGKRKYTTYYNAQGGGLMTVVFTAKNTR